MGWDEPPYFGSFLVPLLQIYISVRKAIYTKHETSQGIPRDVQALRTPRVSVFADTSHWLREASLGHSYEGSYTRWVPPPRTVLATNQ